MPQREVEQSEVEQAGAAQQELSGVDQARRLIAGRALRPAPLGPVGLELEGHLVDRRDMARRVSLGRRICVSRAWSTAAVRQRRSVSSRVGQLELSTPPATGSVAPSPRYSAIERALPTATRRGYGLVHLGLDPSGPRCGSIRPPRYVVMAAHFERVGCGPAGRMLMSSSAGLQFNLEAGPPASGAAGWPGSPGSPRCSQRCRRARRDRARGQLSARQGRCASKPGSHSIPSARRRSPSATSRRPPGPTTRWPRH